MNDKIIIADCHFMCRIGCSVAERSVPQEIMLDIEYTFDNKVPASEDDLKDAINYCDVYDMAEDVVKTNEAQLIETLVERLAERLLAYFPISSITLRLRKPGAMVGRSATWAEVEIARINKKE